MKLFYDMFVRADAQPWAHGHLLHTKPYYHARAAQAKFRNLYLG